MDMHLASIILFIVFAGSEAVAQEREEADPTQSTEVVSTHAMGAFKDARLRLRRGVFRASGTIDTTKAAQFPAQGEITIFCAFDYDMDKLRFDKTYPAWKIPRDGQAQEAVLRDESSKFLRNGDKAIFWTEDFPLAGLRNYAADQFRSTGFFDVRIVGFFNWAMVVDSIRTFESEAQFIDLAPAEAVREEGASLYRLTWIWDSGHKAVWFDESRGMSPTRLELRVAHADDRKFGDVVERSTVAWIERNDVWVPQSATHERLDNHPSVVTHEFDWESVNEPIEPKVFELYGLNLPEKTAVYDDTAGRPVRVRVVDPAAEVVRLKQRSLDKGGFPFWAYAIVILHIAAFALLAAWWGIHRLRMSRKPQ